MDNETLMRNLRSVGMACYVAYHDELTDFSQSDTKLIDLLVETEGYTRTASMTRVLKSREIMRAGRDRDALEMISHASRVAPAVAEEASEILKTAAKSNPPQAPGTTPSEPSVFSMQPEDRTHNIAFPLVRDGTVSEVLALYAAALDELRERGIVRSANGPGGDYAELLCVRAFGWSRTANSVASYDAIDRANRKYQVKSRRIVTPKTSRQLSALRNLSQESFDFLAGVLFNGDFSVMRAAIIPHRIVAERSRFSAHTNSSIFFLDDTVWKIPDVRDITAELRKAQAELNRGV